MSFDQDIKVFNHKQPAYSKDGIPSRSFEHEMIIPFNKDSIHLIHLRNAHTDGDLIVHFSKSNVIHTGDVFVTYGYPFIDEPNGGSIQGVIKAIDTLLSISNTQTLFIPGHGELSTRSDLIAYKDMLSTIYRRVKKAYLEGQTKIQILNSNPTKGYSSEKINESILVDIVLANLKKHENE